LPATLGFLPARKPSHHPALIAGFALPEEIEPGVLGEPRNVTSVYLTLLKPDGSGKADTKKQKLIVGSPGDLPIQLMSSSVMATTSPARKLSRASSSKIA